MVVVCKMYFHKDYPFCIKVIEKFWVATGSFIRKTYISSDISNSLFSGFSSCQNIIHRGSLQQNKVSDHKGNRQSS